MCSCREHELIWRLKDQLKAAGEDELWSWFEARPDYTEAEAVQRAYYFGGLTGCPTYIVHLSSGMGVEMVREAKAKYPNAYAETCPHFLTHTATAKEGKLAKASPPLRAQKDADALWAALG